MNPYQIMGVITICALLFAGVVALLAMQGMHILSAFVCVYVVAVGFMLSLQRRAKQAAEAGQGAEKAHLHSQQVYEREPSTWRLSPSSRSVGMDSGERRRSHKFGV